MMAKDKRFRWRTDPAVVAQYHLGHQLPSGDEVTLKPDEACVVLEDGRIVGVVTQQTMGLDPKAGALARFLGKKDRQRSYLFVHLGPHDLLCRVGGRTADGHDATGLATIRVDIIPEEAARLLQIPAKGETTITLGTLAGRLEPELAARVIVPEVGRVSAEALRNDGTVQRELAASIETELRSTIAGLGMRFSQAFTNWMPGEHERLIAMRRQLDDVRERNELLAEQQAAEAERLMNQELQAMELQHRMRTAQLTQAERERMSGELAAIQARREKEQVEWDTLFARRERQLEAQVAEQAVKHELDAAARAADLATAADQVTRDQLALDRDRLRRDYDWEAEDRARAARLEDAARAEQERAAAAAREEASRMGEHNRAMSAQQAAHQHQEASASGDAQRAMDMFEGVQAAKRQRMQMEAAQESQRMGHLAEMKDKEMGLTERIMTQALDRKVAAASTVEEMLRQQTQSKGMDVAAYQAAFIDPGSSARTEATAPGACGGCGQPTQSAWRLCPSCGHTLA